MKPVTLKEVERMIERLQSAQHEVKTNKRAVQSAITVLSRVALEKGRVKR